MTSVSIIGIGNMGKAIAGIASRGGAGVQLVAREQAKVDEAAAELGATASIVGQPLTGDIVVFAVPFAALDELVTAYGSALVGKVVVDITNPVDGATFDGLTVPSDGSAASGLAERLPGARVVKAFNTNFAATLAGSIGDATTTVLVAGDDAAAKQEVIDFVKAGGLNAEDAGSLKRARELESIGFLQILLAAGEKIAWDGGFALAK